MFSTKYREKTLTKPRREELFKYISGLLRNKKCHLYRIGGVEDHIYVFTSVHSTIAVADLVKDIKLASSDYIKNQHLFPDFKYWQVGYGNFTYSFKDKDNIIEYIKNQERHHNHKTYIEELIELLNEHGIEYDERYLD